MKESFGGLRRRASASDSEGSSSTRSHSSRSSSESPKVPHYVIITVSVCECKSPTLQSHHGRHRSQSAASRFKSSAG